MLRGVIKAEDVQQLPSELPVPGVWAGLQDAVLPAESVEANWQGCKGKVALDEVCPVAVCIPGVLPHGDGHSLVEHILFLLQASATGAGLQMLAICLLLCSCCG